MIIVQLQSKLFGLSLGDEGGAIIPGIAEDGTMIEMCEHLLPFAAMVVIVANGLEDEAVVSVVDIILVVGLRLQQGIACHLALAFDAYSTRVQQTIEANQLDERRVGMLLHYLLYAVERGADHWIPMLTGHKRLSYDQRKDYGNKKFQGFDFHVNIRNKSAVYCIASHQFIKGRWVNV